MNPLPAGLATWRVAAPAAIGAILAGISAVQIASLLGPRPAVAVVSLVMAGLLWAWAIRVWLRTRPLRPDDDRQLDPSTHETSAQAAPAVAAAPSKPGLAAAPWERSLLSRLPGISLVVQRVAEGDLTDWVLLAGHRGDASSASEVASGVPPEADVAMATPELLSHWLARHPQFRPAEVVAALQRDGTHGEDPRSRWRVLPLGALHEVLWLPPDAPADGPATNDSEPTHDADAAAQPAAPPTENERESIAYTVSHDLRAPIRVIEGFTRIVREDYGHLLDRVGNDHLDRVLGAATRMNGMIDALLALSRLSSQPMARVAVPLSQFAGQIVDDLRMQAPERSVQAIVEAGVVAQGDPDALRSVLENLLGNAWKYSARRPEARIEFGVMRLVQVRPDTPAAQDRPVYFVRDNGAGFDMRFADRLFSPFQRLHSASEFAGTGVGLASVRRIVRRHGGDIWAQAAADQGACFYFTLG